MTIIIIVKNQNAVLLTQKKNQHIKNQVLSRINRILDQLKFGNPWS